MKIEDVIKSKSLSLETKTVINISFTSRVIEETVASILKSFDLTTQQFNVLRILKGQNGNPANLSTIQERMVDRSSNTTRLVDKLIQKKLVNRRTCPHNRRKVEILITENGVQLLEKVNPLIAHRNIEILKNLTKKEQNTLNELLDKLRNE